LDKDLKLYLVANSTHGERFEVHTRNFIDLDSMD
jgi:hypothetical protein